MKSLWVENSDIDKHKRLTGNIKTDVLIIGGGMAGILTGYMLKQNGMNCVIAEANRIGMGVTKNTTAKITSQHGLIYSSLIRDYGIERASQYLYANQAALVRYREMASDIDCDFEDKPAFVYSLSDRKKIEREVSAVNRLGGRAFFTEKIPLPLSIKGAVKFERQAQFNPLKFIAAISKDLNIYENTFVKAVNGNTALTSHGNIKAKKIIVATHFPFINTHGSYFLKMYQHRSYIIALENAPDVMGMYVDEQENGMSFRNYNGKLLIGGGDHRTGKPGGGWEELRNFAKVRYPQGSEHTFWAAQDCITLDGIPYIGQYSANTPDIYVATGFNKWGMTSSMAAALILSDMITGKQNNFHDVFSPSRTILKKQLLINAFEAVSNLANPKPRRCTHLGCALVWNKHEHTWECPCHGSRYNARGHVLNNPAMKNIPKA